MNHLLSKIRCLIVPGVLFIGLFLGKLQAQKPRLIIPAGHKAQSVRYSYDNNWLASADDESIKIWDNNTNRLLKEFKLLAKKSAEEKSLRYAAFEFSLDSKMFAYQYEDSLTLVSMESLMPIKRMATYGERFEILFSKNGQRIYLMGKRPYQEGDIGTTFLIDKIELANFENTRWSEVSFTGQGTVEIRSFNESPDGATLIVGSNYYGSKFLSTATGKVEKTISDKTGYYVFKIMPNGNYLALTGEKTKQLFIAELNKTTLQLVRKTPLIFSESGGYNPCTGATFQHSAGDKIVLNYQAEDVVFDPQKFAISKKFSFDTNKEDIEDNFLLSSNLSLNRNGTEYVRSGVLTKFDAATHTKTATLGLAPLDVRVMFAFKNKNSIVLKDRILHFDGGVFRQQVLQRPDGWDRRSVGDLYRITADGTTGYLYDGRAGLYRFNPNDAVTRYEFISKIEALNKDFVGMQIFDSLKLFTLVANDGIYVFEFPSLKLKYIVDVPSGMEYNFYESKSNYCDISPDGTKMILYAEVKESDSSIVSCVNLKSKDEIWRYTNTYIRNIRFQKLGSQLLVCTDDKIVLLDAETGKPVGEPIIIPESFRHTVLSPSGNKAATMYSLNEKLSQKIDYDLAITDIASRKIEAKIVGTGDPINDIVFLKNERYLVTEEYGGLSIWDVLGKRRLAKIYLFNRSEDWIIITDDGRFDATPNAMKMMYFVKGKEVIPLENLYEKFYVPNLLAQIWEKDIRTDLPNIADIKTPPSVRFLSPTTTVTKTDKDQATLQIEADGLTDVIVELRVFQNGKLIQSTRNLTVEDDTQGEKRITKTFQVQLNDGTNIFKAVAINSQRTESAPVEIAFNYSIPKPVVYQPQLYLLVVGVNNYKNPKYSLNYAQADAKAFSETLMAGSSTLFSKSNLIYLKDEFATKPGIENAFKSIASQASAQDVLVFYYAGHGVINDKKQFFLVPYDVTQLYGNDNALMQNGISAELLQQFSGNIKAQKQLFILDACQSAGAIEHVAGFRGAAEEKAIAQLARSTGTQWLTASGSDQFASEFSELGHGSFTFCLLEAMRGAADSGDKKLTVREIDAYLQTKVPELTQRFKGTPQYPASYGYGNDFPIIIIK